MMSKTKSAKQKWISDAAYFKSLKRSTVSVGSDYRDWLEAEHDFDIEIQKRVKSGLRKLEVKQ